MAIISTLTVIFIPIGLCMIIFGFLYRSFNGRSRFQKLKTKRNNKITYVLDSVTSTKFIGKLLNYMAKDKESLLNNSMTKILELSEAGISLQQLYFIKSLCLFLTTILLIVIGYTNTINQTKLIVAFSGQRDTIIYNDGVYDESKYQLYKNILRSVGNKKLSEANNTTRHYLIEEKVAKYFNTSDKQIIRQKTEWFLNTWAEVQKINSFKYYYVIIILAAFFIPEILLIIRWLLRGSVYKKEVIKLEYIFELLARVDGVKTIDIINELSKSSKIFSKCMNEFARIFQYNKQNAFDYLRSKNIKGLSKMANILEIYSLSDKELAIQILDREMMERDEQMIITAEESIDFIDLVAFLSIVPIVYELARLMLDPMLDIVYKAFEFI